MIPENVAQFYDHLNGQANRKAILAHFLANDESHLWPILGSYNVTCAAINILRERENLRGESLYGLELSLELDQIISDLVNQEV